MQNEFKINELRDIWPIIAKRKWFVVLPWLLVSAIVIGGSFLITREYQASTIVLLDKEIKLSSELQGLLGISRSYFETEGQRRDELKGYYNELTSSYYISEMSRRLNLDRDPELTRRAEKASLSQPGIPLDQLKLYLLQNDLREKIGVSFVAGDQIMISAESPNPATARDIANTLSDIFVSEKLKQEMASIRSSQDFSDVQLQKYEKLLQDKINEKTDFERSYLKSQLDPSLTSESNRTEIQSEIDQTQDDINDQQRTERDLLDRLNSVNGLSATSLSLKDSDDNAKYKDDLKSQLRSIGDLMLKYPWGDPQILNNRLKQNSTLSLIEAENKRLVAQQFASYDDSTRSLLSRLFTVRTNLDFYYTKANYLKASLDELKDKINRIPEYQATLDRINREIVAATELRDKFKKQQESSTISQALLQDMSSAKFKIVEPARMPLDPIKPNRAKIIFMGILFGLVLGCAVAVIMELLDSSFRKVEDVEACLNLHVVGVVPKIEFLDKIKS